MEGVGARLGRSSTRYGGPTTVFTGPVRRWKKKWIHVSSTKNNNHQTSSTAAVNGGVNGSNGSPLLLLKWSPINNSSGEKNGDENDVVVEEPRKRKFKYIPIALLEEQKNETSEEDEDEDEAEAEPIEADANDGEPTSQADSIDEKPDINDVPMEENQEAPQDKPPERQDLNESTLDLSLG